MIDRATRRPGGTQWILADACLRDPRLWDEPRRRPSWMPTGRLRMPPLWRREPGLYLPLSCAIAFDAASLGSFLVSTTYTLAHTVGSGTDRILYAWIRTFDNTDVIDTVTWDTTQSMAFVRWDSGNSRGLALYALRNPNSGAHNIVATLDAGSTGFVFVAGLSYSGVKQAADFESSGFDSQNTIALTVSTTAGATVWTAIAGDAGSGIGVGTGTTQRATLEGDKVSGDSNGNVGPGSVSLQITCTISVATATLVAFEPAGAAAPSLVPFRTTIGGQRLWH